MRQIEVTPGFPVFLLLLRCILPAGAFGAFLAAMVVHEFGHVLAIRLLGGSFTGFRLGFAQLTLRTGFLSRRAELFGTAAGPALSLLCALLGPVAPRFAAASLLLGLFNLLPLRPLDGGRLLHTILTLCLRTHAACVCAAVELCSGAGLLALALAASARSDVRFWPTVAAGLLLLRLAAMRRAEKAVAFLHTGR